MQCGSALLLLLLLSLTRNLPYYSCPRCSLLLAGHSAVRQQLSLTLSPIPIQAPATTCSQLARRLLAKPTQGPRDPRSPDISTITIMYLADLL